MSEHKGTFNVVGGGKLPLAGACTLSLQLEDYCILKLSNVVVVDQEAPTMLIGTDILLGQGAHLSAFRIYLDTGMVTFSCSNTSSKFNKMYLTYEYGKSIQGSSRHIICKCVGIPDDMLVGYWLSQLGLNLFDFLYGPINRLSVGLLV